MEGGNQNDWEGSINKVTKLMKSFMQAQEKTLVKKINKQQSEIAQLTRSFRSVDVKVNNGFDEVRQMREMLEKFINDEAAKGHQ